MGFNKRFLSEHNLTHQYNEHGAEGVIKYISKPDAIFSSDKFSELFLSLPLEWNNGRPTKDSLKLIDDMFKEYEQNEGRNKYNERNN
jgi:hypothetical protein